MAALHHLGTDWPALSRLLDAALELPASARDGWLAALPAGEARHRPLLRQLLASHPGLDARDFLGRLPALKSAARGPTTLAPGQAVGPYRLLNEIGRGGMGTVWLAERADGSVRRRVALKLPHAVWGDAFARRLASERQILASLDHPNIARLYDTGQDDQGRPWIAMEQVDGIPIDAWCRERDLSVPDRLALLLQVLGAVAHAHQRLVVHRDLKPANLLVTRDGQVKLLDFGIAKLIEGDEAQPTALTALAGRALTVDYASPEQIRGEPLGTASDVYSLGVVAYELLVGHRPHSFGGLSGVALAQAVADAAPPRPSDAASTPGLRKRLRGDLDAVLARALEKEVARRYPGADAFAQDIARHLAGEPVQARAAGKAYRAAKFVRRHRRGVAVAAALAVSIGAGVGVSGWQTHVARVQAARAESELLRQEAARDLFTQTLIRLAALSADDPASIGKPHAIDAALRDKLDQLMARGDNTPDQVGAMLEAVAHELIFLDDPEGALDLGQRYLAHLKAHGGDAHRVLFATMMVAGTLCSLERFDECEAADRAGLAWRPQVDDEEIRTARAHLLTDLANALTLGGKRGEVPAVLEQARGIAAGLSAPQSDETQALADVSLARYWHGFDESRAALAARQASEVFERYHADADDRQVAQRWWGKALLANGDAAGAEARLRESLALTRVNFGSRTLGVNQITCEIAEALSAQGRYPAAHALLDAQAAALDGEEEGSANRRLLLGCRLAVQVNEGDVPRAVATAAVAARLRADPTEAGERLVLERAEALLLAGRNDEARRLAEGVDARWTAGDRPTVRRMRALRVLAWTRLAAGDANASRAAAIRWRRLLDGERATAGAAWREATEVFALACARSGDAAAAATALRDLAAVAASPFRSAVDRAESSLNRAEVFAALGQEARSQALARAARLDLRDQSPDSPRLRRVERLSAP